tara:strand:+ start:4 stop:201 length:198 start_codon:yes stop_codon:yes gene_type:complete
LQKNELQNTGTKMTNQWTIKELHEKLAVFEKELKQSGKAENTIKTYVDRSDRFLRWLVNDYDPFA